jgi:hypothetical protein
MIFCPRCKRQVEHSDSFYLPGPLCAACQGEETLREVQQMTDEELLAAADEVIEALVPWPRSLRIVSQLVRRWQEVKEDYRRQQ